MKYSNWVGGAACLALVAVCFLPWTYHDDVKANFTGFFSQNNTYGTPGKYLSFFAIVSLLLILIPKIWAKRVHLLVSAVLMAYALKTYILYTSCYNAYCPEKQPGIFLMVGLSLLIFAVSLFPDIRIPSKNSKSK